MCSSTLLQEVSYLQRSPDNNEKFDELVSSLFCDNSAHLDFCFNANAKF